MYTDLAGRVKDRDKFDADLGDVAAAARVQQARQDAVRAAGGFED